ncbi:hypothetical protein [Kribbibacterium absianum]|uniref:hypothetical protein n=1 Tax=Kribbibacterium absianum TaxID=3044210 RepID=UPI0024BC01E6|nr:hypothetical protein [Olsenella sp. YH-ols2216]MDJ1122471.1 hypothetical protein [Olsenella sp. YH-ols2216]
MTNLTKEEYAKLHLKAKRGLLTPEEQAVYFEYKEEQAEAAKVNTPPPVQPQTPPVQNAAYGQPQMQGMPYGQPAYGAPMGNQNPGAFYQPHMGSGMRCPRCGGTYVSVQEVQNHVAQTPVRAGHHGCLYWVFIGWWVEPLILLFITVPRLIFNAAKPRTKTHAVCQTCGHSWTVR